MIIINLPNGKGSFTTKNEVAGEFIESIVKGGEVTLSDLKELDKEGQEVVTKFTNWNYVYVDKESDYLYLRDTLYEIWKMSGYDMAFGDFLEEFYECVDLI